MKKSIWVNLGISVTLLLSASTVTAEDAKIFIGSACSFANNPLRPHDRMHHRFKNNSTKEDYEWVTCPIVRDETLSNMEWAAIDIVGDARQVTLEMRDDENGELKTFPYDGVTLLGVDPETGKNSYQYYWFQGGDKSGNIWDRAALAIEVELGKGAFINMYRTIERD